MLSLAIIKHSLTLGSILDGETNEKASSCIQYMYEWQHAPVVTSVILAQNPYPSSDIIPYIGCPFSYTCEHLHHPLR